MNAVRKFLVTQVLLEFNSADACDPSCIYRELGLKMPGDIVPVKVLREGRPVMVHIRLEARGDLP